MDTKVKFIIFLVLLEKPFEIRSQQETQNEERDVDFELIDDLTNDLVSYDDRTASIPPAPRVSCYSCLQIRSERVGMFGNCNTRDAWQVSCSSGTCGTFRITRSNRENFTNRLLDIGLAIAESLPAIPYIRELRQINGLNATALIKGCFTRRICDFSDRLDQRDRLNLANIKCRLCQGELCNSAGMMVVPMAKREVATATPVEESTQAPSTSGQNRHKSDNLHVLMALTVIVLSLINKKNVRVK